MSSFKSNITMIDIACLLVQGLGKHCVELWHFVINGGIDNKVPQRHATLSDPIDSILVYTIRPVILVKLVYPKSNDNLLSEHN